jgi:hypothetical protein
MFDSGIYNTELVEKENEKRQKLLDEIFSHVHVPVKSIHKGLTPLEEKIQLSINREFDKEFYFQTMAAFKNNHTYDLAWIPEEEETWK